MTVVIPGSEYLLDNLTGEGTQPIQFTRKAEGGGYTDGTTNEEVISVLIDRLLFFQSKAYSYDNETVITLLQSARRIMQAQVRRKVNRRRHDATSKND